MQKQQRIIIGKVTLALTSVAIFTSLNSTAVKAETISNPIQGIVETKKVTPVYTKKGQKIKNRSLNPSGTWVSDQKLFNSNGAIYYRVATNEYVKSSNVKFIYGLKSDGTVKIKSAGAICYTRTDDGFTRSKRSDLKANTVWKYNRTESYYGTVYYQISNDIWVNSDDASKITIYQNPSNWLQIQNTQIKPYGTVGYNLISGSEGVKTWLVRRHFGLSNTHTIYDSQVASKVSYLQRIKNLPVTGVVNLATWQAMGFSENSWYSIDSYIAPLKTNQTSTREDHIEAIINQAHEYLGKPWISGASSSPEYGIDCSGLVMQALYASGVDPAPVSSINHTQPGNEWNSQQLWADARIPQVNFDNRQRGDLIFFTNPATGSIWHVGIMLDRNTMIDSWPDRVQIHSIYSDRGNIAGVKRVFQ